MVIGAVEEAIKGSTAFAMRAADERISVVIVTRDMAHEAVVADKPRWRATVFYADGPVGHTTNESIEHLARDLADDYCPVQVRTMKQADVDKWMGTPEFKRGCEHVAHVQAENERRWRSS